MKVLFVTNYPAPYRVEFFNELGKKCELTVLFEEDSKQQKHRNSNWFNENYINFKAIFLKQRKMFNKFKLCFDVIKYVNNSQFDIIISCNPSTLTGIYSIIYMKVKGIKFAIEADGAFAKNGKGIKEIFKKFIIGSAEYWISSSSITDEYFLMYGAKKENIFRYPFTSLKQNDILKSKISNNEKLKIKEKLNIKQDKVIISVGRFIDIKGFDVLIKSAKYFSEDYGVYIIGGKATSGYIELINKFKLRNIQFIDFKTKDQLKEYFLAADIFVLPTRGDAWGLVINEAMAYGLPVITTDRCVAGLELIKDNLNGFIVPVDKEKTLAMKIEEVFSKDNDIQRMSEYSLDIIRKYTIEEMTKRHMQIFNKILEGDK